MENSSHDTRLLNGLPAVLCGDYWVVLSPYAERLIRIPKDQIDDPKTTKKLVEERFLGRPSGKGPGALSDYFQLTLITTSDCNLRCRYCFADSGETQITMREEVALTAVRQAIRRATNRGLLISFFGGEPSLTQELIKKVVCFAKQPVINAGVGRVRFGITTNGVINPSFLEFLIDNDFFLTVSMDGLPVIQDYQRPLKGGGKSAPILERTIKTLVDKNQEFMIRATVTDRSVRYLVPTVEYLHCLGVKQLHCEAISLAGRALVKTKGRPMECPTAEDFAGNLKAAISRAGELGMGIFNSSYMNLLQPSVHFCDGVGGNRISISYTGEVTTCLEVQNSCHPAADDFIIGYYDEKKDQIVINSQKQKKICDNAIVNQNECCRGCFASYVCSGGCPIRNYHMTGNQNTIDPFRCQVIKSVLPFVISLFDQASEQFD